MEMVAAVQCSSRLLLYQMSFSGFTEVIVSTHFPTRTCSPLSKMCPQFRAVLLFMSYALRFYSREFTIICF